MKLRTSTVSRSLSVIAVGAISIATIAIPASALSKPRADLVPGGATVLYWNYPLPIQGKVLTGTITVTKQSVINEVRALINSLPVSTTSKYQACPADAMLPYAVSFARSRTEKPFTKVVFQLGGCPYAQVYQHGVAVRPTLGGTHLAQVYATIQHLISPKGQPLA